MWGKNETNISFHLYYSQAHFRYVGRCERPGDNWNESVSNIFFTSGCVNRCYFMCSVACFREIYLFIQQTFKKSSCFVRNCKLQCRCSREVKTFLILQSFSGNVCGFDTDGAPAMVESCSSFKKTVQELASKAVYLKVGWIVPLGAILNDKGMKRHEGGENAQPLISHWVNFSSLILWLVSSL